MPARYTGTAIALHWIIGLLMVVNVALAWAWPVAPDEAVRTLINNHKSIGITVLALVSMRLLWRLSHRPPALPEHHRPWEKRAAHAAHMMLYVVMFAMPLSGWIMDSAWEKAADNPNFWFGLFEWPRLGFIMSMDAATKKSVHDVFGQMHEVAAFILYFLVIVHVGGALKHQFLDKDKELARMGLGKA